MKAGLNGVDSRVSLLSLYSHSRYQCKSVVPSLQLGLEESGGESEERGVENFEGSESIIIREFA